MKSYFTRFIAFWIYVFKRFFKNDATYRAAALTYASLLALVPLLIVILKILSLLPLYDVLTAKVQMFMFNNFVVSKGSVLHHYVNDFARQSHRLSFIGSLFLIIMSVTVLVTMQRIFDRIWGVQLKLRTLKAFLRYWSGVLIAPAILLCSVILTSILLSLPLLMQIKIPIISVKILFALPFILTVLGFTVLYYAVPNCKVKWSHAFLSGLFATLLFGLSKTIIAWYLAKLSVYTLLYGAFAIVPIILLWFYVVWIITLLGAEVCHALGYRHHAIKQN